MTNGMEGFKRGRARKTPNYKKKISLIILTYFAQRLERRDHLNDKELQELYLERNKLNCRIEQLEKERLSEARAANKNLVGQCFKCEDASTVYLKIVSVLTKYNTDKYVKVLCFVVHPTVFDFDLFFFEEELIDTIHQRYTEISKEEFNTKASEVFERMLNYEG